MSLPPPPGAEVRVMLCDDSATARAILRRLLEAEPGIRVVHQAADGRAALDALAAARHSVVAGAKFAVQVPVPLQVSAASQTPEAAPQVLEDLRGLRPEVAPADELPAGVERDLAGQDDEAVPRWHVHDVRVAAGRRQVGRARESGPGLVRE